MKFLILLVSSFFSLFSTGRPTQALEEGETVPEWSAKNQLGQEIKLSDLKGSVVFLYFYPKDDTPGCTQQACTLRDGFQEFKKRGVRIFGLSPQNAASHLEFQKKHTLPFDLLVDDSSRLADLFGIRKLPFIGWLTGLTRRESVLLFPLPPALHEKKGTHFLKKRYQTVDPVQHPEEVLKEIDQALFTAPSQKK